jgi:hypothetical protein
VSGKLDLLVVGEARQGGRRVRRGRFKGIGRLAPSARLWWCARQNLGQLGMVRCQTVGMTQFGGTCMTMDSMQLLMDDKLHAGRVDMSSHCWRP